MRKWNYLFGALVLLVVIPIVSAQEVSYVEETSVDGIVNFEMPEDWMLDRAPAITILSTDGTIEDSNTIQPGQQQVVIIMLDA